MLRTVDGWKGGKLTLAFVSVRNFAPFDKILNAFKFCYSDLEDTEDQLEKTDI